MDTPRGAFRRGDILALIHFRRNNQMSVSTESAPRILDIPIGLNVSGTRKEFDSLGTVEVPANP
jgi:hypothetical protein